MTIANARLALAAIAGADVPARFGVEQAMGFTADATGLLSDIWVASGSTVIEAGQSYWLWAVGGDTTWCGWCMNIDPGFTCPHTIRREGEDWLPVSEETASAFRVDIQASVSVEETSWSAVKDLFE